MHKRLEVKEFLVEDKVCCVLSESSRMVCCGGVAPLLQCVVHAGGGPVAAYPAR